jgi:hypothetical protein
MTHEDGVDRRHRRHPELRQRDWKGETSNASQLYPEGRHSAPAHEAV